MRISKIKKTYFAALPLFLLSLALVPAQGWSQQWDTEQTAPADFTNDQVAAFARAQLQIDQINHKYQEQLANVTELEEQQAIFERANDEMVAVIQGEGLSVEVYNAIVHQVPDNPELQQRISDQMQQLQTS